MSLNCSSCPECYENITITVQTGLAFQANDSIQLYDGANAYIYGSIVSYDPITGVTILTPCQYCGEIGAITGWTISLSGIPGVAGSSGTSGTSGTSATSGTSGTDGTSGTSGSDGTSGTTGTSGTSGTDGTSGTSGTSGTDGTSGTSGGTGSSGSAGSSGTSGTSGGTGSSGSAGSSGTSGTSGTSGSSGTAGTAGSPGTSGTSGTSGLTPDPNARNETTFTATAGQTVFSVTYNVGQVDVYYNGSKLSPAEFTATNGTSITLATPCIVGDIVDVVAYVTGVTGTSGTAGTSGTSGTTGTSGTSGITPANQITGTGTTNTLPKFTASSTIGNSLFTDNGTNGAFGGANYSGGTDLRSFNISAPIYAGLAFWANNVNAADIFGYGVTGNLMISADPLNVFSASNLIFTVDGTTRLTINSNGTSNFIGVISQTVGTSTSYLTTTAGSGLEIRSDGSTAADRNIAFKLGTTTRAIITNDGNVGINTTSPQSGLGSGITIEGSTYSPLYLSNSGTLRGFLAGYSGGVLLSSSTGFISLNNGGGNVLIGTTSDAGFRLDVSGSIRAKAGNGNQLILDNSAERFTQLNFQNNTTQKAAIWWDNTNNELGFLATSSGTTHFKIASTGVSTFSSDVNSSSGFQGRYSRIFEASAQRGGLYPYNLILGSGSDYSIGLFSEGEIYMASGGSATKRLVITSAGLVTTNADAGGNAMQWNRSSAYVLWYIGGVTAASTELNVTPGGSGGVKIAYGAGSWSAISDVRLKTKLSEIPSVLDGIKKNTPFIGYLNSNIHKTPNYMLSAQELLEVFPHVVDIGKDKDETLSVRYTELIPILFKGMQEQQAEIEILKSEIDILKNN